MLEGRKEKVKIFGSISLLLEERRMGENASDSALGDLKMKPHLPDPLTSLAFSREEQQVYVKKGRTGVSVSFMGLGFRRLLCFAAGRLRIKLYMKYLSPLYQSPFNG